MYSYGCLGTAFHMERLACIFHMIINICSNVFIWVFGYYISYGKEMYSLLRSLVAPAKPKVKVYRQVTDVLTTHFKPTPISIAECFKFYDCTLLPNEKINDFIAAIWSLAWKCDFGEFLEEAIQDKLVCGISNSKTRKRLLVERDLNLLKTTEISNAWKLSK